MYALLKDCFEMGWRRINEYVEHIPETDKDRDYGRIQRLIGCDDLSNIYRTEADAVPVSKAAKKEKNAGEAALAAAATKKKDKADFNDLRSWFHAYEVEALHDHEIFV
jgi:hypothetical protein